MALFALQPTHLQFGATARKEAAKKQRPHRKNVVAVYGGNSIAEGTPLYDFCKRVGKALADNGLGVLHGGGEGAMKALSEGARHGYTLGMAMPFIGEDHTGTLNDEIYFFNTFRERIDEGYERYSGRTASVPGGIGSLQEITKKATELYLNKTLYPSQRQIVLFEHKGFWKKFVDYLEQGPVAYGLMSPKVLSLFRIAKTPAEGVAMLKDKRVPWVTGARRKKPVSQSQPVREIPSLPEPDKPRDRMVAVYGGHFIRPGSDLYGLAKSVGESLAKSGYGIITADCQGAMRAVAQGAREHDGTILKIPLVGGRLCNTGDNHSLASFYSRLDRIFEPRSALTVALPGGMGTLLEVTKKACELYVNKTPYPSRKQIILVEYKDFWKRFLKYLRQGPVAHGLMNPKVLDMFKVVPAEDVVSALRQDVPWTTGVEKKGRKFRKMA